MFSGISLSASVAGVAPMSLILGALLDNWVTFAGAIVVVLVLVGLLVSFATGRRTRAGRSIEQTPMPAAEQSKKARPSDVVERATEAAPPPATGEEVDETLRVGGMGRAPLSPADEAEPSPWLPLGSSSSPRREPRRETDADAAPAAGDTSDDSPPVMRGSPPGVLREPPPPEAPAAPPRPPSEQGDVFPPSQTTMPAPQPAAPPPVIGGLPSEPATTGRADGVDEAQPALPPLRFTALHPREVPVATWQTLLVYTHVASAAEAVLADAAKFQEELGARPREVHAMAARSVERGTQLTIVPACDGVRFNPERISFTWDEDMQRSSFRFEAAPELAGSAGNGEITVYVGPLIVSTLKFSLLFDQAEASPDVSQPTAQTTGQLFEAIFASYSHDDSAVVLACRNAYKALGLNVNIDIDSLRSGDHYDTRLLQLIDASDIFQLFWSERSARSEYVRREWSYALEHSKGSGFIRPVYWKQPLVPPPPELGDLHFTYIELPALGGAGDS